MNIRTAVSVFLASVFFCLGSVAHATGTYVDIEKGDTYQLGKCGYGSEIHACILFKHGDTQYVVILDKKGHAFSEWIQGPDGKMTFVWERNEIDRIMQG
ncbi:MAG: hypothetical protein ACHQU0_02465 [Candidatus Paceibacteria bacterium]